jgi:hypothetical protein
VIRGCDSPEQASPMNLFAAYFLMVFAALIGGGSLLFRYFIIIGPVAIIRFDA